MSFVTENVIISDYHFTNSTRCVEENWFEVENNLIRQFFCIFHKLLIRCSTCLSFNIALIRTLVIKYPLNPKIDVLSKQKSAFFVIIGILLFSAPINIFDIYKYQIILFNDNYKCEEYPEYRIYFYGTALSELFQTKERIAMRIYKTVDAIVSKIAPCILFPIITFMLIREIRKTRVRQQKLGSSSAAAKSKNTSRLVLFLTLPFFIAELPLGIVFMISPIDFFQLTFGFSFLLDGIEKFFTCVLSGTTAIHMIVCVFMSAQYRDTALAIIRCGFPVIEKREEKVTQMQLTANNV
ncbi:hypothetical protein CRE_12922 [Caenorhabditis remanei]|uniref:G-protein coupled receptors family 1 profile domain-containing protein n=1 Tax=Caenorhabditis remanei TaxID=31234 RepID=E3N102_CAERE|nr:hypothetical protein CRE_12922 [Caenorhabditis remanei]